MTSRPAQADNAATTSEGESANRTREALAAKIVHLQRPDSYPEATRAVATVETHFSFVFLTERHAYKMKKPVRGHHYDFSTLEARKSNCETEVAVNRRLSPDVYLGVVPLARVGATFVLEGSGDAVEWLVKMRRLPRACMLDTALAEGRPLLPDLLRVVRTLLGFYRDAEPKPLSTADYVSRMASTIQGNHTTVAALLPAADTRLVGQVFEAQVAHLHAHACALGARGALLVDGHGDLRPEHVCLSTPPLFIDALEFDADLRRLDPADEIGYLAMECLCAGDRRCAEGLIRIYRSESGDRIPSAGLRFYQALRAGTRAKLAACHLEDGLHGSAQQRWRDRARRYLRLSRLLLKLAVERDDGASFVHASDGLGEQRRAAHDLEPATGVPQQRGGDRNGVSNQQPCQRIAIEESRSACGEKPM